MVSGIVPVVSWNLPLGSLDSDGGFKIAFHASGCFRSYKTAPRCSQNDQKYFQYYAMSIESNTVLTTLWTQAQTHLRVPLPRFTKPPKAPKQFLWATR